MADNNKGWNQLTRNKSSFKTDNIDLGDGLTTHSTYTFNGKDKQRHDSFNIKGYPKLNDKARGLLNSKNRRETTDIIMSLTPWLIKHGAKGGTVQGFINDVEAHHAFFQLLEAISDLGNFLRIKLIELTISLANKNLLVIKIDLELISCSA